MSEAATFHESSCELPKSNEITTKIEGMLNEAFQLIEPKESLQEELDLARRRSEAFDIAKKIETAIEENKETVPPEIKQRYNELLDRLAID
jgi:molecular chaperone DnaK (HSP70)